MVVRVNPEQARRLIDAGAVDIIDVRDAAEWASGHIPGARLVELATLRENPRRAKLPRAGILFVCAGGVRSQTAGRLAIELGITLVYSLTGGTQSWMKAGLPLSNELSVAV